MPSKAVASVCGVLALPFLAGAGYLFVRETAPIRTPVFKPPVVHLSAAELAAANTIPEFVDAIPVLTFHDVSDRQGEYTVTPRRLAETLAALKAAGFHSVSLDDVTQFVAGKRNDLPSRPILLTFDDGLATNWTVVDPMLAEYGFRAVAFLITGRVVSREPSYYLSWRQVQLMRESGRWEFGAHTHTAHGYAPLVGGGKGPALINRLVRPDGSAETFEQWRERVVSDLDVSVQVMERELGRQRGAFAFPFNASEVPTNDARIPPEIASLIADRYQLGFRGSLPSPVVVPGSAPLGLPRISVRATTSPSELLSQLREAAPLPPPASLATLPWLPDGTGSCKVSSTAVTLQSAAFLRCQLSGNSAQWDDYRLSTTLVGSSRQATAIIALRSNRGGRVEVAIGESRAEIRQQIGKEPMESLGHIALSPSPASGRAVRLTAVTDRLRVEIDGKPATEYALSPNLRTGHIGLALAATGDQSVTFGEPDVNRLQANHAVAPLLTLHHDPSAGAHWDFPVDAPTQ